MNEMLTTKSDFGKDNLKYVNKEIAMQWLGIAPPEGAASLTDAQQSIANIIQNFENPKIETRNSLITPEMDASYLDAVERGDMETAQRMVMEAAKLAMPNTKVVDEDGNPKVVYHGTPNNFNAFSKEMFGTSTDRGIWGNGFYFSDSEQYAKTYEKRGDKQGRTLTVFLNIENPLFISLRNGAERTCAKSFCAKGAEVFSRSISTLIAFASKSFHNMSSASCRKTGVSVASVTTMFQSTILSTTSLLCPLSALLECRKTLYLL